MTPVRHRQRTGSALQSSHSTSAKEPSLTSSSDPKLDWVRQQKISIEYRPVDSLRPSPRNARTHSKKQIRQISESIKTFGFANPMLLDKEGEVIAGHGRLEAAKLLGWSEVPVVELAHLTPSQVRAYRLADNRLAEKAGWDNDILTIELGELLTVEDLDIELTGFEMADIDIILTSDDDGADPEDNVEEPQGPVVSRVGDLWHLGNHRIFCADAREQSSYETLLDGEQAQMVFTDPPYNVPIQGHVSGLGKVQHREFVMASGEMSSAEFTAFLKAVFENLVTTSTLGSIHYICIDWRHLGEVLDASDATYSELKNLCVWNKDNAGMGSFYRSKHELVFVLKNGAEPHINNFGLGDKGRYRTNVWDYPGANTMKRGRGEELAMHPTVKPVAMVADAIKDCSKRNGIILDAFGGSGTTLIAAERTGRRGYLLELDPRYVDVTIRRWQKLTGQLASHAGTGLTFDKMVAERISDAETHHG